jgi:alpha-L-arabinofuranosidase
MGRERAANGTSRPYPLKYWQIGNEISGDDPKYLEQFPAFVALDEKGRLRHRAHVLFPLPQIARARRLQTSRISARIIPRGLCGV